MTAKIFSFFSGCGLLDLGFEKAGHDISFVNEYWGPFLEAYKHSRSKLKLKEPEYGYSSDSIEKFLGDKKHLLAKHVNEQQKKGALVGFIGGPPCPDFSVGGKNKGATGDNGRLSQVYADLIIEHQPDFFLFENVKGLWRTKKHRQFYDQLKATLEKAGYVLFDRLINAIEYGAPQYRERIILLGFKKKIVSKRGLSKKEFPWLKYAKYPEDTAFQFSWPTCSPFFQDSIVETPEGAEAALSVEHWFLKNDVQNHPNSEHYFKPRAGLERFLSIDEGDDSKKSFKRLHRWRYSPTACYGNNEVHLHPYKARRISVAEALAIQSLPKEFELPESMSLTNMFKTIGNGVPYLAALSLALSVSDYLNEEKQVISKAS